MNPDTIIAADAFDGCTDYLTVYCIEDSAVWTQAIGYGWAVKALGK